MKVFLVVTERDGETTKSKSKTSTEVSFKTSTEIVKSHHRFAAETFDQVCRAAKFLISSEETITAIVEEHPAITILGSAELP